MIKTALLSFLLFISTSAFAQYPSTAPDAITQKVFDTLVHTAKTSGVTLRIIDDKEINGMTSPTGYIYLTQGYIDLCGGDPNKLAVILAHELGHWVLQMDNEHSPHLPTSPRNKEIRADLFGIRLMDNAGYNIQAVPDMWRTMMKIYGNQPDEGQVHPPMLNRLQYTQALVWKIKAVNAGKKFAEKVSSFFTTVENNNVVLAFQN